LQAQLRILHSPGFKIRRICTVEVAEDVSGGDKQDKAQDVAFVRDDAGTITST
jgi:hypothetical protein